MQLVVSNNEEDLIYCYEVLCSFFYLCNLNEIAERLEASSMSHDIFCKSSDFSCQRIMVDCCFRSTCSGHEWGNIRSVYLFVGFKNCYKSYNKFHYILRLFDVLRNFPFTTSETMLITYKHGIYELPHELPNDLGN